MPGTHPKSSFEHQFPELGDFSEMAIAQGSENSVMGSKRWPCYHYGCNRSYGRLQDVKRHIRDKHDITPECFICGIKWTRAEKIRKHLISRHRDHFTEDELQEIGLLEGLNNTVDFLKKWELSRLLRIVGLNFTRPLFWLTF